MAMTDEDHYLEGKIAGIQLAFETFVRISMTDTGRLNFARFLGELAAAPKSRVAHPRFRAGFVDSLKEQSASLLSDDDGGNGLAERAFFYSSSPVPLVRATCTTWGSPVPAPCPGQPGQTI